MMSEMDYSTSKAAMKGYGWPTGNDQLDMDDAKSYLSQNSSKTGMNIYDHLSRVLTQLLNERPKDAVDIFEDISSSTKKGIFTSKALDVVFDKPDKTEQVALAEIQEKLFSKEVDENEDDSDSILPNLYEMSYFFEQAGVGLSREEMIRIWLSMKQLIETRPVDSIRFWGKVLGTERCYVVAECEYREGEEEEDEEENQDENDELDNEDSPERDEDEDEEGDPAKVKDDTPKPTYKRPPNVPKEQNKTGVNKKTYFVCNEPGAPWVKLPLLTPAQITGARLIKKFFTGNLDAPISSYPPFPGNESNYLRAQIARISAGTQISPAGFYQFDEEEEEDEDGGRRNFIVNADFEPLSVKELTDPTLSNWVHHVLHILPQGRTRWWNPTVPKNDDLDENEDDEDKEEPEEAIPEVGPPLLTPLSEDAELNGMPAWTGKISSKLVPQFSCAVVHSCVWPGAHAFASGRNFENIYIGWGHKYSASNHNPALPPPVQNEFPTVSQPPEMDDPKPEEEAALRADNQETVEGEEEEGEEEEGDDNGGGEDDEENNEDEDD